MNGGRQSDSPVVPAKPANESARAAAESVEERGLVEGNTASAACSGHGAGTRVPRAFDRVRQVAERGKKVRFTALLHHVDVEALNAAYWRLRRQAAPGEGGVRWADYGQDLEANLLDLHDRIHRGAYRPKPSRRVFIPKTDGRQRPLGIATTEDKIVQSAVVEVLNAIYEADFLGFSYGFRPGRKPHDALDALVTGLLRKEVNWVLDADIRDFFTSLDHGWLEKFCEHRIGGRRVLRLIQKWVEAGAVEDGSWAESERRTPQGATVSPLLANVYLHYVFDQWVERWRRRQARGDMIVVRYADDFVVGFEHRAGAERFLAELSERFAKFGLELKVEKTRLIEFGRFAAVNRAAPAWASGDVQLPGLHAHQRQDQDRVLRGQANHGRQADAGEVERGQGRTHAVAASTHPEGRTVVGELVRGHIAYYAVPGNLDVVRAFCEEVKRLWLRTLRRRSQRHKTTWERMQRLADRWLPKLRVLHPYPEQRFDATTRGRSPVR